MSLKVVKTTFWQAVRGAVSAWKELNALDRSVARHGFFSKRIEDQAALEEQSVEDTVLDIWLNTAQEWNGSPNGAIMRECFLRYEAGDVWALMGSAVSRKDMQAAEIAWKACNRSQDDRFRDFCVMAHESLEQNRILQGACGSYSMTVDQLTSAIFLKRSIKEMADALKVGERTYESVQDQMISSSHLVVRAAVRDGQILPFDEWKEVMENRHAASVRITGTSKESLQLEEIYEIQCKLYSLYKNHYDRMISVVQNGKMSATQFYYVNRKFVFSLETEIFLKERLADKLLAVETARRLDQGFPL